MAKIIVSTGSYNDKRYGKPYIALCDDQAKVQSWGSWLGTPGREGELSIDVPDTGVSIVMQGQKDFRGSNGTPTYALVVGGALDDCGWTSDKMDVVRRYREAAAQPAKTTDAADLQAERERLVARIAEIDAALSGT